MLLTKKQLWTFWHEWSAVIRKHNWPQDESEYQRKQMLERAGFSSLTLVDKLTGFDKVLAEIKALSQPSDLEAQLRQQNQPRARLIYACRKLADEPYITALASSTRFKSTDWTTLPLDALEQLRNTLADRGVAQHRQATLARRKHTPRPTHHVPRLTFPSKDLPGTSIDSEEQFPDQVELEPAIAGDPDNQPF